MVDQRQHGVRLVHEMAALRAHQPRRGAQFGHQAVKERLDFGHLPGVGEIGGKHLPVALMGGEREGVDVEIGAHPRRRLVEYQHYEEALFGPGRRFRVDRAARASEGASPAS